MFRGNLEGMWVQRGIELFEEDPEYQAKLNQFQKWHPPTLGVHKTPKMPMSGYMRCKDHHKVLLATFMLRGEVRSWWKRYTDRGESLTWRDFIRDLYET
ncbi:hypothetical protein SLA2020_500530 [Shorea laevis]